MARSEKLDTTGFFLLGLSSDNESTMKDTIEFARRLPLDILKFGITIGFPGTPMFNDAIRQGTTNSFNWDDYFIYTEEPLFHHPKISYDCILKYMKYAYRRAVLLNPRFWMQRIARGIRTGEIFWDAYYFLQYVTHSATSTTYSAKYYAKDRWPVWDFTCHPPKESEYQVVGSGKTSGLKVRKVA